MPVRHRSLVVTVTSVIALAAFAGGLAGQDPEPGRGYPSADWSFTGGNWSSSRYTALDAVATDTVDRLGGAWVTPLPGGAASRATPGGRGRRHLPAGRRQRLRVRCADRRPDLALGAGPRGGAGALVAGGGAR